MGVIALLAAVVGGGGAMAFFSAAMAVGAVWFFAPLIIVVQADSDLPARMANIMGFDSELALFGLTALIGFVLGGLGALTGNRLRKLLVKDMEPAKVIVGYSRRRRWW